MQAKAQECRWSLEAGKTKEVRFSPELSERHPRRLTLQFHPSETFTGASLVVQGLKNLPANAEDMGLIPGWGRSSGGGNGNPLQYSCLGNSLKRGAWLAAVHGVMS